LRTQKEKPTLTPICGCRDTSEMSNRIDLKPFLPTAESKPSLWNTCTVSYDSLITIFHISIIYTLLLVHVNRYNHFLYLAESEL